MERSLVLIKPDGIERGLAGTITSRLEQSGLKLVAAKMLKIDTSLAERHYAIHTDKPFFKSLVEYITSGPVLAAVFEAPGVVELVREIMGKTDPAQAQAGTIRGDYGLDIEHNTIHGSDSPESAENETALFFGTGEIQSYERK
jgi:nucleoside-diphosphate kinase